MRPECIRLKISFALTIFVLHLCCVSVSGAMAQEFALSNQVSSVVSGRVTIEGKPAEGIRVILIPATDSSDLKRITAQAVSDKDGSFRLAGVPAGAFTLSTESGPFILPEDGYQRSPGKSVVVADGQNVSNVDLDLCRGGVITGRVTDAEGEPVIAAQLSLQRLDEESKKYIVSLINQSATTDDLGVFRLYGLRAGKYIVSVTRRSPPLLPSDRNNARLYTPTTYYPGVSEEARAVLVAVKEGAELRDVDISIASPTPSYSASGQVVDLQTGNGIANIGVTCIRTSDIASVPDPRHREIKTDAEGRFRLGDLKPGQYVTFTNPGPNNYYSELVPFEIRDVDVGGLELKLSKGSWVTGFVQLLEAADNSSFRSRLNQITVLGMQIDRSNQASIGVSTKSQINADGSFTLYGLRPGQVRLGIYSGQLKEISLARVEAEGIDRTQGIMIGPNESIAGVKLILSVGMGHIVGQVRRPDGPLPFGSRTSVTAVSLDSSASRRAFANADAQGRFTFINLPAGEYEIRVTSRVDPDANGKSRLLFGKKSVSVKSGVGTEVTLVLDSPSR